MPRTTGTCRRRVVVGIVVVAVVIVVVVVVVVVAVGTELCTVVDITHERLVCQVCCCC